MSNTINVAFTSDKNYFAQLAAAIMSVKNNMGEDDVHIYVLTDEEGMSSPNVERIERLCQENLSITFLCIREELFEGYNFSHPQSHLTLATIYCLFLEFLLPEEVEKIIFLGTDMAICSDLHDLFAEDVNEVLLAAVVEDSDEDRRFIEKYQKYLWDYYESEEELYCSYFNAGTMVINMAEFRRQNIGHQCLQMLTEHPEFVCYDQDVLNIICKGKVKYISPEWNRVWRRELADGSSGTGCLAQNIDDIKIIHYCTGFKPWTDPEYRLTDKFMETVYETEWYPEIISQMKETTIARVFLYKFPWDQVKAGSEIIIYGAGEVGEKQIRQMKLSGFACVHAVLDKNADKLDSIWGIPVMPPEKLKEIYQGEIIVIGILKEKIRLEVKNFLIQAGIPEEKIVWDYEVE